MLTRTTTRDYYETLGVEPDASAAQIKEAYRDLAFILHPDRLPAGRERTRLKAEEYLKRLNVAYEVLGDPGRRCHYDRVVTSSRPAHAAPAKNADRPTRAPGAPNKSRDHHDLSNALSFLVRVAGLITLISLGLLLITTIIVVLLSVVLTAIIILFVVFAIAALLHS